MLVSVETTHFPRCPNRHPLVGSHGHAHFQAHISLSAEKLRDVIHYQAGFSLFLLNEVCYSLPSRGDYSKP